MSKESDAINNVLEEKAKKVYKLLQIRYFDSDSPYWSVVNDNLDELIAIIDLHSNENKKKVN